MGKLYYTEDVMDIIRDRLDASRRTLMDDMLTDHQILTAVHELQSFQKFADMIESDLNRADMDYEEEMAAFRANNG